MSKGVTATVEAIGGAFAIAAGVLTLNPALFQAGLALEASAYSTARAARQEIAAKNAYNASLRDRYAMLRSSLAPRQFVYGRCRVSGPMFYTASFGTNDVNLTICVALAAHEVDGIEDIYFDGQPVTLDGAGNVLSVRQQDSFSMTTSSTTVTVSKTPASGTVTAEVRYGDNVVPLTVSVVSGVSVTVTGGTAGQVGQLDVYYQPNPDPYAPNGVTQRSSTFTVTSTTQTFSLPTNVPAPDASGVHAVYQVSSSTADDAIAVSGASVSGYSVTLSGLTVGRKIVVYYQTANGLTQASVRKYLGAPGQVADAGMIANFPGTWTAAHKASGVAYLVVELVYSTDAFSGGVPEISAVVRGAKCFDPRTSVTAWTENPALHARDLATQPLAGNLPTSAIDDDSFITAANVCDTSTTYTVGGMDHVRALYTSAYSFTVDRKPMDGLNDLCQAMGGGWVFTDGQLRVNAGAYRTPNPGVLDETWLADDQAVQIQIGSARASLLNTVTGSFADQYQDYVSVPLPQVPPAVDSTGAPIANPYAVSDGTVLSQDIQYTAVPFSGQAQYLSACMLRRQRQGMVVTLRCNYRAWQDQVFDVRNVTLPRFGWMNKPFEVLKDGWTPDGSLELVLQETDPSIWDMDAGFSATDIAPNTNLPVPWGLPSITSLAGISGDSTLVRQSDGTLQPRIQLTWDAITDDRVLQGGCIEIRYWRMGDLSNTFETIKALGTDTQAFLNGVRAGSMYLVCARTASVITQGQWCQQIVVTASGKSVPPGDVVGMAYTLGGGRAHLTWTAATDPDYKQTEVRVGSTWASGTFIGAVAGTALDWPGPGLGSYTLWFAHQNFSGLYSADPASLAVTIDASMNSTAFSGLLTSDTASLTADATGHVSSYLAATTTMTVLNGAADVTSAWTFSQADSAGVASALSGTLGNVCTVSAIGDSYASGYVDITASRTGYASITKRFALSKSNAGHDGVDGDNGLAAPLLTLSLTSQTFSFDGDGNASPTSQTITATAILQNVSGTITWTATGYSNTGASLGAVTLGGTSPTRTLAIADFGAAAWVVLTATLGSLSDTQTIWRLRNGQDAVTGDLTNQAQQFAADAAGNVSSFTGGSSQLIIYRGLTDDSSNWSFAQADSAGVTSTISGNTVTITAFSNANDTGYVDITASRTGFISIVKRFSLAKSKSATRVNGINGNLGSLSASFATSLHTQQANVGIQFNADGRIYTRQGLSTATYVATSQAWWIGAPSVAPVSPGSYTLQWTFLASSNSGSGTGSPAYSYSSSSALGGNVNIAATLTNGIYDLSYAYQITDASGAILSSGNLTLHLESTD